MIAVICMESVVLAGMMRLPAISGCRYGCGILELTKN